MVEDECDAADTIESFTTRSLASPVGFVMDYAAVEPTLYTRESFTRAACASPAGTGSLMAHGADTHLAN